MWDQQALLETMVLKGCLVLPDHQANRDQLEIRDQQEILVHQAVQDLRVNQDLKDLQEILEQLGIRDQQEMQDQLDQADHLDNLDHRVLKEILGQQVLLVPKERKVSLVHLVALEQQEIEVPKVLLVQLDNRGLRDHKDLKVT
jgi:hypothetical protein